MRFRVIVVTILVLGVFSGCSTPILQGDSGEEPSATELSFTEVTNETGPHYASTETGAGNGNDGIYVADYDNDLREDILAIGGESPTLFHNAGGVFKPTGLLPNVSGEDAGRIQGALWFDHDNDGWEDLLLLRRSATPVLLDNDNGSFERHNAKFETEFDNPVSASTADYNGDGCLDLFIIQYGLWSETTPEAWNDPYFESDNGNPNKLYRGTCGNGFELATNAGVGPSKNGAHWSLATSFVDLNGDNHPDIHVANDYYNDTVYYNTGNGSFTKKSLGAATDRNGMSSEVAHLIGNERPELFVTNIYFPQERIDALGDTQKRLVGNFFTNRLGKRLKGNNLLVSNGQNYEDQGETVGLAEGGWGWAAVVTDLDSDGAKDVFHGTQDTIIDNSDPVYNLPKAWVQHEGKFYRQNSSEIGLGISDDRGVAQLDYDLDGAVDIGIATYNEEYLLYRNDAKQGNSLQIIVDPGSEGTAIGAELTATIDGQTRHLVHNARADYQSQDSRVLHVGLGDANSITELKIRWPDGTERTFTNITAGQRIQVSPAGIQDQLSYED